MIRDAPTRAEVAMTPRPIAPTPKTATEEPSEILVSHTSLAVPDILHVLIPGCLTTAPHAVVIPQPSRQTRSRGALGLTATTETSATTVYCEKVEVPIYTLKVSVLCPSVEE